MRKVNQILMATVAILLTLVLISTSVVSSVFARFTITKSAETTVTLQQFGVKIELTPKQGALVKSTTTPDVKKGDSVSMQFTSSLAMDETLYDALNVKITGTPSVDVKFIMTCEVDYDFGQNGKYSVPTDLSNVEYKYFMPLGFTLSILDSNEDVTFDEENYVCRPYQSKSSNGIEEIIIRNAAKKLIGVSYTSTSGQSNTTPRDGDNNSYLEKKYNANEPLPTELKNFYMGFDWLTNGKYHDKTYPTETESVNDKIATHISENAYDSPIKITYTFTIIQAN